MSVTGMEKFQLDLKLYNKTFDGPKPATSRLAIIEIDYFQLTNPHFLKVLCSYQDSSISIFTAFPI